LGAFLLLVTGVNCSFHHQFSDASRAQPHALLTAQPAEAFLDSGPKIFQINGQPTSFWRSSERFRLPTGPVVLHVVADRQPYRYAPLRFVAKPGHHYDVRYENSRSKVALYDVSDLLTQPRLMALVSRDKD